MKWRFFSPKKHIKFGRMIKRDLFKVCSIASYTFFPYFGWEFVDISPVKIFPFCREPFIEPFFHIFVRTKALLSKCVTYRCKQVVIERSQVWWVSRMGKNFPAECFQRVSNWFMWWSIVMEKNDLVLPLLVFWSFLAANGSNRSIVVDSVSY